jgi:hypothetical protein
LTVHSSIVTFPPFRPIVDQLGQIHTWL